MEYDSYIYTNKGGKGYNEDCAKIEESDGRAVFVVADGLGGHMHGDIASKCVADSLTGEWNYTEEKELDEILKERILEANNKLLLLQKENQSTMKSTAVMLVLEGSVAACAHVGDSRLYYIHGNSIRYITQDHSVAFKKYKAGEITRDEIAHDEDQPCLLRTLGGEDRFMPDIYMPDGGIEPGDAFLLCSDGAWEYLQDEEIVIDYLKAESAEEWVDNLLLRIISRIEPESDNLTLLSVMVN